MSPIVSHAPPLSPTQAQSARRAATTDADTTVSPTATTRDTPPPRDAPPREPPPRRPPPRPNAATRPLSGLLSQLTAMGVASETDAAATQYRAPSRLPPRKSSNAASIELPAGRSPSRPRPRSPPIPASNNPRAASPPDPDVPDDQDGEAALSELLARSRARSNTQPNDPASATSRSARSARPARTTYSRRSPNTVGRSTTTTNQSQFQQQQSPTPAKETSTSQIETLIQALSAFKPYSPILAKPSSSTNGFFPSFFISNNNNNNAAAQNQASLFRRDSQDITSNNALIDIDISDPSIMNQLASEAIKDSDQFQIMTTAKYDKKRRQLVALVDQINSLQNKLSLVFRSREAAEALVYNASKNPNVHQLVSAQQQLTDAVSKSDSVAAELWTVFGNLVDSERTIFMHLAGVLRYQLTETQKGAIGSSTTAAADPGTSFSPFAAVAAAARGLRGVVVPSTDDQTLQKQLTSSESRVRELEQHIEVLKGTVTRLELEQEPMRQLANDAQRDARRARQDRAAYDNIAAGNTYGNDVDRMRLEFSTSRAEMVDLRDQLNTKRDAMSNLQLQLDEDQTLIESKDRMISNLLAELEETVQQLELVRAGGAIDNRRLDEVTASARASLLVRDQLNEQVERETHSVNAVLSTQMKEAVLEREKLKLLLNQEREHVRELEERVKGVSPSPGSAAGRAASRSRFRGRYANANRAGSSTDARTESDMDGETEAGNGNGDIGGSSSNSALPNMRSQIDPGFNGGDADTRVVELTKRLRDAEYRSEDLQRRIRTLESEKSRLESDVQSGRDRPQRSPGRDRSAIEHRREIQNLKSTMEAEHAQAIRKLEQELSAAKASSNANTGESTSELRRRLEASETELVTSKQQFFVERERLQEQLDESMEQVRTVRAESAERASDWDTQKKTLIERVDSLSKELTTAQASLDQARQELGVVTRNATETATQNTAAMETLKRDHAAELARLQTQLNELTGQRDNIDMMKRDHAGQIESKNTAIDQMTKELQSERDRAREAVDASKEAQAEATDQLRRVERLLQDAERDIDRYRRLATEKDDEMFSLKKQLRQKDKALADSATLAGSTDRSTMRNPAFDNGASVDLRRLLDQKDRDIETARAETRTAVADLATLKRKLEQKDREIQDIQTDLRRRAQLSSTDRDAVVEEYDLLQVKHVELKTAHVMVLEQVDDLKFSEEVLNARVVALKSELDKLKAAAAVDSAGVAPT